MAKSGMDHLVEAILRASGVDAEKIKTDIVAFGQNLQIKIESMDTSMRELREEQRALREILMEGTYTKTLSNGAKHDA
jgi:hypothetical protein